MDCCILCSYQCLSLCGLRNWIIRTFAYHPNDVPSYTFRSETYDYQVKQQSESMEDTKLSDQSQDSIQHTFSQDNQSNIHSLRFHRISSVITEKDARHYKVQKSQLDSSKKSQLQSLIPNVSQFGKEIKPARPKDLDQYIPQRIKLIDRFKRAIDFIPPDDLDVQGYFLKNSYNKSFPVTVIQQRYIKNEYCLLHSHGNSPDIGIMLDSYFDLCFNLEICVVGYDYPGFGQSEGEPNDIEAISNAEAVYKFVNKQLGFKWNKIILYGQSIGSGPSTILLIHVFQQQDLQYIVDLCLVQELLLKT